MDKKYVLVVDDDPLILRMYQHKLTADGYEIQIATNGQEALDKIKESKPSLVLLDVMMPRMTGVETLKAIKADKKTSNIPVIFLTNLEDNKDVLKGAKELGALDYLVKAETSLKELSARVKKVLG